MRASGIVMHITSLPGPYGVGPMGKQAFAFVDFLQDSHRTGRETTFGATQIIPQSCLSTLPVGLHLMSLSKMAWSGAEPSGDITQGPFF